jgi:hypothetical protein
VSVAPEDGRNRIMIYGPKPDGTYIVEFKTVDDDSLAISVPRERDARAETFPGPDAIRVICTRC